jgi:hypothetical protein
VSATLGTFRPFSTQMVRGVEGGAALIARGSDCHSAHSMERERGLGGRVSLLFYTNIPNNDSSLLAQEALMTFTGGSRVQPRRGSDRIREPQGSDSGLPTMMPFHEGYQQAKRLKTRAAGFPRPARN